ncbi:MAG: prefoldin subunit alpha, partial [Thermoplasmata archaeon]
MENEKTIDNLLATAELLKKQIENLNVQIAYVKEQIDDHNRAKITLENYLKIQENEVLVNVGADTFLYLNVNEKKRAMIPLGSGIVIESSIERAIEMLNSRIKDMNDIYSKLLQENDKAQSQYLAIEKRIEEIYREYQGK